MDIWMIADIARKVKRKNKIFENILCQRQKGEIHKFLFERGKLYRRCYLQTVAKCCEVGTPQFCGGIARGACCEVSGISADKRGDIPRCLYFYREKNKWKAAISLLKHLVREEREAYTRRWILFWFDPMRSGLFTEKELKLIEEARSKKKKDESIQRVLGELKPLALMK